MLDFTRGLDILNDCYSKVLELSPEGYMVFLGVLTDQFCADKGMTSAETCEMLQRLCFLQFQVHAELGMMPASTN